MNDTPTYPVLHQYGSGPYVIRVQGEVERHWALELRMQLTYAQTEQGIVSVFSGELPDQAALIGVLQWLNMWGYVILAVHYATEGYGDPGTQGHGEQEAAS
jgi:hypothetical protein